MVAAFRRRDQNPVWDRDAPCNHALPTELNALFTTKLGGCVGDRTQDLNLAFEAVFLGRCLKPLGHVPLTDEGVGTEGFEPSIR